MAEGDEEKIGFHTEEGVYRFTHMPKELKNLAATLQRMMKKVLADQIGRNVEIFLEEIVIKSKNKRDLVQDVEETLRKLKRVNIKIDPIMSSFRVKEGRFFGHIVTKEGVRADPEKVSDMFGGMWGGQRGMRVTGLGYYEFGGKGVKKMYSVSNGGEGLRGVVQKFPHGLYESLQFSPCGVR
ncbi:hypothetical protein Tco_1055830 [Tanacetum coccineum]|uniref:Reverse transcriptase domain-containing protein n=1 Tax=Tanacetum coccineum TaxID=301880 RepID=A0ABQ5H348_9ASTR